MNKKIEEIFMNLSMIFIVKCCDFNQRIYPINWTQDWSLSFSRDISILQHFVCLRFWYVIQQLFRLFGPRVSHIKVIHKIFLYTLFSFVNQLLFNDLYLFATFGCISFLMVFERIFVQKRILLYLFWLFLVFIHVKSFNRFFYCSLA